MFRLHYAILLLLPLANANYKLLQQRRLDECCSNRWPCCSSYPPFQLTKGRCKKPIQTAVACANAVSKLAWHNTTAIQIKELSWGPKGCFFLSTTNSLYFNTADEAGSDDCSNLAKCGCEHCDDTCVKAGGEVSTCVDTPGWTTLEGLQIGGYYIKTMTCEQLVENVPRCKDGKVMFPDMHDAGNQTESDYWNEPEKNCCICGKGSDDWKGWEEDCTRDAMGKCTMSTLRVVLLCLGFLCFVFCLCACVRKNKA